MDRTPAPDAPGERALLLGWLNFHRDALAAKCAGLTDAQLVTRLRTAVEPYRCSGWCATSPRWSGTTSSAR